MLNNFPSLLMRKCIQTAVSTCTYHWSPYSRLIPAGYYKKWVIGQEMREVSCVANRLGIKTGPAWAAIHGRSQAVFIGNHFDLLLSDGWFQKGHRLATAYFHGKPGTGVSEFDKCFEALTKKHQYIHRVQVSCRSMQEVVLASGIDPQKVHLIPIGVNPTIFTPQTPESRVVARKQFGVPHNAVVVGSFQKDGNGLGEGLEPKSIKGPDIFIKTMRLLKQRVSSLVVLLSGPARGYVKKGLNDAGVPYIHHIIRNYADIGKLYQALDVYVISSRQEGGPKAVLESMASGIPLVSTRVGQAVDLVSHGENGWLADVEDYEGLADLTTSILELGDEKNTIINRGLATAYANTYESQFSLWKKFFEGFVSSSDSPYVGSQSSRH